MVSKEGFHNGVQHYKCASCKKRFTANSSRQQLKPDQIWHDYLQGKQTYQQLAAKYGCSVKTIQRRIDTVKAERQTTFPSVANVLMDTTYFGTKLGVMVFKDSLSGQILYKQYVKKETNKLYLSGIEEISRRGIRVQSIICDGRKGLPQLFEGIPVQMCMFEVAAVAPLLPPFVPFRQL